MIIGINILIFPKIWNFELQFIHQDQARERIVILVSVSQYVDKTILLLLRAEEDSWPLSLFCLFEPSPTRLMIGDCPPIQWRFLASSCREDEEHQSLVSKLLKLGLARIIGCEWDSYLLEFNSSHQGIWNHLVICNTSTHLIGRWLTPERRNFTLYGLRLGMSYNYGYVAFSIDHAHKTLKLLIKTVRSIQEPIQMTCDKRKRIEMLGKHRS